jgi:hypothetical protein
VLKEVSYPKHILKGITPNHRAYPRDHNLRLFSVDTETCKGLPMTVQAHDGVDTLFQYVDSSSCFDVLMSWLFDRSRSHGVNIAYVHYLKFDLPVIFVERRLDIYEQITEISFKHHGYACKLLFGKVNKAEIEKGDRKVTLLDSWAFTHNSLDTSFKQFQVPFEKHPKPPGLGEVRYDSLCIAPSIRSDFEKYAQADVVGLWHLARRIMDFHEEFKVRPCISLPQFGSRVLRHHFFKSDENIQLPPEPYMKGCELGYHGGKNGLYVEPCTVVEDVFEADISSAYPHAMVEIPQLVRGSYLRVRKFNPDLVGLYRVSGRDDGKYPLVFDAVFRPVRGVFKDQWITSYELAEALKAPDVDLVIHDGIVWVPESGYNHNPIAEYVHHFYHLKDSVAKDDPNRVLYKLLLNAITGKFIQAVELRRIIDSKAVDSKGLSKSKRSACDFEYDAVLKKFIRVQTEHRAGGLYQPFLAALITGHTRARIYREETRYDALHTATDAIKTIHPVHASKGLGGFELQTYGRCYLFRNKLYLHMARNTDLCGHDLSKEGKHIAYPKDWHDFRLRGKPVLDHDGQHLCKYALHGFKGSVFELFEHRHDIIRDGFYRYTYDHMVGLREGMRQHRAVCSMWHDKEEVLRLREAVA